MLCCFPFPSLILAEKMGMGPSSSPFVPEKMALVNWEERARCWWGTATGQALRGELGHPPPYLHRAECCPPGPCSQPCSPATCSQTGRPNGRPPGPSRALHTTEGLCDLPAPNLVAIGKGRGWRECVGPIHAPSPDSQCP